MDHAEMREHVLTASGITSLCEGHFDLIGFFANRRRVACDVSIERSAMDSGFDLQKWEYD
jgi:hypothetical protein